MSHKYQIPKRQRAGAVYSQEELYREYYPIILKLLIMRNRDRMDAEDITHNVFLKILLMWDQIDWDQIEQLISIVLYHRVVNFYRENDCVSNISGGIEFIELADNAVVQDPFKALHRSEFRKALNGAFVKFTKSEKEAFYGYYVEGKTSEELRGNRSRFTVFGLLNRARAKVVNHFRDNYGIII